MVTCFLAGLSESNIVLAQSAIADTASRADRSRLFGYIYLSASLAYVVGPLGGGQLADPSVVSWFSYATPYWTVTVLLAGTCVAVIACFQETHQGSGEKGGYLESFTNLARVVTDRRLRPLYLVNFVLYLAIFGFFRVYPMYLVDEFHMGVGQVSEYVAFVAVPIVVANVWLVGALSRHARPRTMVLYSALAMGVLMGIIVIPKSTAALWFTLGATALALAICLPSCAAMLSLAANDQEQGRAMGNNQSMQVGAESLSGLAGGALAAIEVELPLLVFAGVAVAGGVMLANLARRRPSEPVDPVRTAELGSTSEA
jgi:predicted MFS family arabinose efflux permease